MLFLIKINNHTPVTNLVIGESFFYRPAPGAPWFKSIWQRLTGQPCSWRYVDIPRVDVPPPSNNIQFVIEGEHLMIGDCKYTILDISLRRVIVWLMESLIYWTFDESWNHPNIKLWRKTGGRGR